MPELPEVETVRLQLERELVGQRIKQVRVLREKSFRGDPRKIERKVIRSLKRKAKLMIWKLVGGGDVENIYLMIHLKMTGQLVYVPKYGQRVVGGHPTADWVAELPSRHTRVILELERGELFFNDVRVFGWLKVGDEDLVKVEQEKYGMDVLDKRFTVKYLRGVLASSRRAVKSVILDQKKIGGLGNIYANDGLFYAKINPHKPANKVVKNSAEVERLWQAIKWVIEQGLKYGGASERNYVHSDGFGGEYQDYYLVYGGGRCKECGRELRKDKIGGRSSWWCEHCQK